MAATVIFDVLAKDRASQVFRHVGAEAKRTGTELETLGHRGGSAMGKLASAAKTAVLGVAGVAAVTGVVAVKMAANFQTATSVLQTAAGETTAGLKTVRKGILDIAVGTGTTWQNLTDGMYQVEKAGYRGAAGLRVLQAAAQGAKEENANLEVVTNAMTSVMASYHLGTDKSVQVMNALKTAAAGSKDTMQNFAASLSTVLPIASAAGISFDQVGGAIAGLTRHGTSAAEATQELAFTIRNLQAPTPKAIRQMEQLGISSTQVAKNLGKHGLSGTLDYLVGVIAHKMGPSGLILQDTFKKSASASSDLQAMLKHMSPAAHQLADELLSNSINVLAYRKSIKKLPEDQLVMARQFATLATQAGGFSDALRKGGPQATTMAALLKTMLGGSTGLNTALQLTGENQAYVNEETKKTAASLHDGSKQVEGWAQTQSLFNTRLDSLKQSLDVLLIKLGNKLLPTVSKLVTKLSDGLAPGGKLRAVLQGLGQDAEDFGKAVKPAFSYIGDHPTMFKEIAKDAVILGGVLKARSFLTGLGLLKGAGGARLGGGLLAGGAASRATPVPVFVTNKGFGIGGKGGPIITTAEAAAGGAALGAAENVGIGALARRAVAGPLGGVGVLLLTSGDDAVGDSGKQHRQVGVAIEKLIGKKNARGVPTSLWSQATGTPGLFGDSWKTRPSDLAQFQILSKYGDLKTPAVQAAVARLAATEAVRVYNADNDPQRAQRGQTRAMTLAGAQTSAERLERITNTYYITVNGLTLDQALAEAHRKARVHALGGGTSGGTPATRDRNA